MAAELVLLRKLHPRDRVVFDGLRSCITRRGWRKTAKQSERSARRYALWRPEAGCPRSVRGAGVVELATPPLRWQVGQVGTKVTVPAYARRDLAEGIDTLLDTYAAARPGRIERPLSL
jgi:hypothetical protein